MTHPYEIATKWQLSDKNTRLLVKDFIDGTYFYLTTHYSINKLQDYFDAMDAEINGVDITILLAAIRKKGQNTPEYAQFKTTFPEFFI